jgi:ABC-type nitrate/sulfonate/bicarbonate transport system substrate-binding protein
MLTCLSLALAVSAPAGALAQAPVKVRTGHVVESASYLAFYAAQDKGFFAEQGVTIDHTRFNDSTTLMQAAVSGSLDLFTVGSDAVINVNVRGGAFEFVCGQDNAFSFSLVVGKDIQGYADLKGKKIAVVALNQASTLLLKTMLARNGLTERDYDLMVGGGTPLRAAALQAGEVKAALLVSPFDFTMEERGFKILGRTTDYVPEYTFTMWTVSRDWAARNEATVVRFLRAILKATAWVYEPGNKAEAIQVLAQRTKATPAIAQRTYELIFEKLRSHTRAGEISRPGLQNVLRLMSDLGALKPPVPDAERFINEAYLQKARAPR